MLDDDDDFFDDLLISTIDNIDYGWYTYTILTEKSYLIFGAILFFC